MSFWNTYLNYIFCVQIILTETCPAIYWYFRAITWCILQKINVAKKPAKEKEYLLLHFSVYEHKGLNSLQTCSSSKGFQFITDILGSGHHSRLNTFNVSRAECTTFFRRRAEYGYPAQVYPVERASIHVRVHYNWSNRVGSPFSPVHLRTRQSKPHA